MFLEVNINLLPRPEKKTFKRKKKNYRQILFRNIDRKIFDKVLANGIHQYIKRIMPS